MHPEESGCLVCADAALNPSSPNRRGNPSLLISLYRDEARKNILIDIGKTFRESACRFFKKNSITHIDAILLTHEHADHVLGLDDLRSLQWIKRSRRFFPCVGYATKRVFAHLQKVFHYIVNVDATAAYKAHVTSVEWKTISTREPFSVEGLVFTPLVVEHGPNFNALGFLFGEKNTVAYIPDVSMIPADTMAILEDREAPLDVLIIDALFYDRAHPSHINLLQALEYVKRLRPRQAYFVGISDHMEHFETNREIAQWRREHAMEHVEICQLPYDGKRINIDL